MCNRNEKSSVFRKNKIPAEFTADASFIRRTVHMLLILTYELCVKYILYLSYMDINEIFPIPNLSEIH